MSVSDVFFEKAMDALKNHHRDKALAFLVEAIKAKPEFAEAWIARGNIQRALGRHFDALLHYDRAIDINPNLHDAWCNRGAAFADIGLFKSAEESYHRSLELMPAFEPHLNLANMYCHEMRLEEAEIEFRAAVAKAPERLECRTALGLALLGQGRWDEGFADYSARHLNSPFPPKVLRLYKQWQGENLNEKTILLWPEQGFGDEIMGERFATEVANCGARVLLAARPPMARLAASAPGVAKIVLHNADPGEQVDYACALLDVPGVLGTTPETIPAPEAYLTPERAWRLPEGLPEGLNVGLCWSAGQRPLQPETAATSKMKSIPLEWLRQLEMPGINLISLQKDNQDKRLAADMGVVDLMDYVADFEDTAELIAGLDLVISVDTAVAHLAAAMGKPTWNLVRHNAYWPWMRESSTTAWYPSMRLFRQPSMGDWNEPINRVVAELVALTKQKEAA